VPRYKEANPALFTTVTFPFLFGIMFGDIGHGSLLFLASAILVFFPNEFKKYPSLEMVIKMRYMLLMMGFFAVFCGFIYNDFLSIPLNIFGSCYNMETGNRLTPNCIYPFGIDPVWYLSQQELQFMNSVKMKIAVIFGVCHMMLGLM
jgi:V-type H+-transporting ATPase subunit a